jgi:hypothetical protein
MTNDGNSILREIDVSHPAAKSMIELCKYCKQVFLSRSFVFSCVLQVLFVTFICVLLCAAFYLVRVFV